MRTVNYRDGAISKSVSPEFLRDVIVAMQRIFEGEVKFVLGDEIIPNRQRPPRLLTKIKYLLFSCII